ncbi:MAG TPA: hypothetical protein VFA57_13465 [Pseudolabrys sp.]|nr:hypothetical protein [Pseudolabrys sp.]
MAYRIALSPELTAKVRYLYEETDVPVHEIAKMAGMSRGTLNSRVGPWGWTPRRGRKHVLPAQAAAELAATAEAAVPAPFEPPLPHAERMRRLIDAVLQVAERTVRVLGPRTAAEAERTGRILALVSRTVQEMNAVAQGHITADEADSDSVPRDMDEFRETLARRIRMFIEDESGAAGAGGGEAADEPDGRRP